MKKICFLSVSVILFFGSFHSQASWRKRDRLIKYTKLIYNISVKTLRGRSDGGAYIDEMIEFLESFNERAKQLELPKSPLPITVMIYEENYDWPSSDLSAMGHSDVQFVSFYSINTGHKSAHAAVDMIKGILDFRAENKEDLDLIATLGIILSYNLKYSPWLLASRGHFHYYYNFIKNLAQELRQRQISGGTLSGKIITRKHGSFKNLESLINYLVIEYDFSRKRAIKIIEDSPIKKQIANSMVHLDVVPENHVFSEASSLLGPDLFAKEGENILQVGHKSHSAAIDWLVEKYGLVEGVSSDQAN